MTSANPHRVCYALHTFPPLFLLDISVHFYICPYDRFIAKTSFPPFLITFCILHTTYARPFTHLSSHLNVSPPHPHLLLQPYAPIENRLPPSFRLRSFFFPKAKSRCQPYITAINHPFSTKPTPRHLHYHQTQSQPENIPPHPPPPPLLLPSNPSTPRHQKTMQHPHSLSHTPTQSTRHIVRDSPTSTLDTS
jgi:hypothetical protein